MPGWRYPSPKRRLAIITALVAIVALSVFRVWTMFDTFTDAPLPGQEAAPEEGATGNAPDGGPQVINFLQSEGFDPDAPDVAVILHPALTGLPGPVAVTDPAVIRAAAPQAYFTDNRSAEARMVLFSVLFFSPPGAGTRATMVSLFRDGREVATLTCFVGQCPRAGPPSSPYDLAGLVQDARPVRFETETVIGVSEAQAFEAEIRSLPDRLLTNGTESLPDPALRFDGLVWISLPTGFGPREDFAGYTGAEEQAQLESALGALRDDLPFEIAADRLIVQTSWAPYVIHEAASGRPVSTPDGYPATDGWLPQLDPRARIWVDRENAAALRDAIAAFDWPEPAPPPADATLAARMPDAMAANGLTGAPGDFRHRADVHDLRDELEISPFRVPEVVFGYFRPAP